MTTTETATATATAPAATTETEVAVNSPVFVFDNINSLSSSSSASSSGGRRVGGGRGRSNRDTGSSVADRTYLASSVGSVVGPSRTAFLRSVAFYAKENQFGGCNAITFEDSQDPKRRRSKVHLRSSRDVLVKTIDSELAELCMIEEGDIVTKINGKSTVGPSYNAKRCTELLSKPLPENIISIQTGNDNGLDTIIQVTIIKPHPKMTAEELGLGAWWWRGLCIRYIKPDTLFACTPLKTEDVLESINDIILEDRVDVDGFHRIIQELPCEITLTVKRGKHRVNGGFN